MKTPTHTPGPLNYDETAGPELLAANGYFVAHVSPALADAGANAARLAACWNACIGLPLPDPVPVGALAEAVAALRAMVKHCDLFPDAPYNRAARAALVKLDTPAVGITT